MKNPQNIPEEANMKLTNTVNIFTKYEEEENHFTNGLIALLSLSKCEKQDFIRSFLHEVLGLEPEGQIDCFHVLEHVDGTADAELSCGDCFVQFETKIRSGSIREDQVQRHLNILRGRPETLKKLILLTPDDSMSGYTQRFLSIDRQLVNHLPWMKVYNYLDGFTKSPTETVFSQLVEQFLERIHGCIFEQDMAGIVAKIDFGDKAGVFPGTYLDEMKKGFWKEWNTPREYKNLDGTGRKLLLYDRTRGGITLEVEIKKVEKTGSEPEYPWTNEFVHDTLFVFPEPIPLEQIRAIAGFEYFGKYKKDRSAYRNITHEQYRQLLPDGTEVPTKPG
jgi:hypothetical protein